jgi:6-phosphofructokinase 1
MNACIAAIVCSAAKKDIRAVGLLKGFEGFVNSSAVELDEKAVSGIAGRGGTILGTSRNGALKTRLESTELRRVYESLGIDSLVVLGGGGSITAAKQIEDAGFPVVAIPCTIDNDVAGTDYTIGFDSACNHVIRMANDITDSAEALDGRVFVIETLGGDTGHIAVASAYAIGADAVLVPEMEPDLPQICGRIKAEMDVGKPYSVIVVAEGAGPAQGLVERLTEMLGRRVRVTSLGHAQRGGSPTYWDRKMARAFGEMAVDTLTSGASGTMTAMRDGEVNSVPLSVPTSGAKAFDLATYNLVNRLTDEGE